MTSDSHLGDSLHPFGGEKPHTPGMSGNGQSPVISEAGTTGSYTLQTFTQALEMAVCEKIKQHVWYAPNARESVNLRREQERRRLDLAGLRGKTQTKPYPMARRWCWFFLYSHPQGEWLSSSQIGRKYKRDHSSILSGIKLVRHEIVNRPHALQAKCLHEINDSLAEHFGPFDIEQAARG